MTVQEQLRDLLLRHCATIRNQVAEIGLQLEQISEPHTDQLASIKSILGIAHQIRGTSGSMGFQDVSALAAALEGSLRGLEVGPSPLADERLQPAFELLQRLRDLARDTTPDMSPLYHADVSRLAARR